MGIQALANAAIIMPLLAFLIVDLVFHGIPPPAIFETGIAGGDISLFLVPFFVAFAASSVTGWKRATVAMRHPIGSAGWLGPAALLLTFAAWAALIGAIAQGANQAAYDLALKYVSIVVVAALLSLAVFLAVAGQACARLVERAPGGGPARASRISRLTGWTAWFSVAPGLVFAFGANIRYPTWAEGWPVFLGVIPPIAALVAFVGARRVLARWRDGLPAADAPLPTVPA
jgi:hypothetical protein